VNIGRCSGILLHITSLPGPFGIGDLGSESRWFADVLAAAGQKLWCVLPVGPIGDENSPYQARSAFAGNPLLLSPEELVSAGYLSSRDLTRLPRFPRSVIDFPRVRRWKTDLLLRSYAGFSENRAYEEFVSANAWWLDDFAQFMALREANRGSCWTRFDPRVKAENDLIRFHKFTQYEFDRQWRILRKYCEKRGVSLLGDMPFYVEHDSSDVWSYPEYFDLDEQGEPRTVGGVPPDYFSEEGQRWGTPTYRWDRLAASGFRWWVDRMRMALERTPLLRLDHFRGFESYWSVPAQQRTARHGHWVPGPGADLFEILRQAFGPLPIVAENLGVITPEVDALRRRFALPGMAVLQFGFDDDLRHRPCYYSRETVAFTGTHDNDTTCGWWQNSLRAARSGKDPASSARVERARAYLQRGADHEIHWSCMQAVHTSVADVAIVPMQDVLGLSGVARMNVPGKPQGNWRWRMEKEQVRSSLLERLRKLTAVTGRC